MLQNTRKAIDVAERLRLEGFDVFCPHLSVYYQIIYDVPYEEWLVYDFNWIDASDALFRMDGESSGADREEAFAKGLGKPILKSVYDACVWKKQVFEEWQKNMIY